MFSLSTLITLAHRINLVFILYMYMNLYINDLSFVILKVWNASNYTLNQTVSLGSEVRTMVVSSDIIYMGCKGGIVEVWCRKKLSRKETLQTGTNCRVVCMALNSNEDVLLIGTSDGRIQVIHINLVIHILFNFNLFQSILWATLIIYHFSAHFTGLGSELKILLYIKIVVRSSEKCHLTDIFF